MPLTDLIIILLFACANIGTLLLLKQMRRDKQAVHIGEIRNVVEMDPVVAWLNENALTAPLAQEVIARLERIEQAIAADGKKTRKETQEIKTALRDDEKDDQRAKLQARARKALGKPAA